jgi:acyl-coenzyme A synthetase/AMP-(fatty) acid ligase/acyl carrier protein
MQEAYGLTPEDCILQKTPTSFDVAGWELFWPLITGARLVMARPGGHQDPAYLVSVTAREQVTTVHFVPSMLQAFLEQPGLDTCGCLARVICSGEALSNQLRIRFHERIRAELHNLYGPTEASIDVTFWQCEPESPLPFVPIGRPIANTRILILDPYLNPVPLGIPGEIYLGGVGLARGYLGRPDLTAERFIPDRFSTVPGERLYRTGDLGRFLDDGAIEYLGRIDHQVKIRGFRIELGEIESVLAGFPGVREVVLLAREDHPGDRRLVAYYVPEPGWGPAAPQLRGYLQSKLPAYMVPAAFVTLESMPLTPNGKVDRRALPVPDMIQEVRRHAERVVPQSPLESLIASICSQVLRVKTIGLHDNFFELGGNSLLATQVVAQVQEILPIEIDLRHLFEAPTVFKLAEVIEARRHDLGEPERALLAEILADYEEMRTAEMRVEEMSSEQMSSV